jgi:hypothetical protein
MKENTMDKKICLVSVEMFNAPGMLRWARHFYRMPSCSKQDKKYFLGVMEAWIPEKKTAKYCLDCPDDVIEWDEENNNVTITIKVTK